VSGAITNSPSDACANLSCLCFNFFSGPKCENCGVNCKNGGVPDPDCLICRCGEGTGWMGHDCSCQYYILGVHVKTQTTDLDWLTNSPTDLNTFKQTFGQDMAVALSISPDRILVQDVQSDGVVYESDYLGVKVLFYLTEECVQVALSQTNIYKPTATPVAYYDKDRVQQLFTSSSVFSFSSSSDGNVAMNGSNPNLDALVALIRKMYGDTDTILYRGYITGKINSAQNLDVVDPSQNTSTTIYLPPTKPWIATYYWVVILIGIVALVLIGFLV
jgi:hypothetical protein